MKVPSDAEPLDWFPALRSKAFHFSHGEPHAFQRDYDEWQHRGIVEPTARGTWSWAAYDYPNFPEKVAYEMIDSGISRTLTQARNEVEQRIASVDSESEKEVQEEDFDSYLDSLMEI